MATIYADSDSEEDISKAVRLYIANMIADKSKELLIEHGNVDTGLLINNIRVEEKSDKVIIIYDTSYASALEYGEKDPTVRFYDIKDWLKRKYRYKEGKELDAKAAVITRRIKNEGTYPHPYIKPAIISVLSKYE